MSLNGRSARRNAELDPRASELIDDPETTTIYLVRHGRTELNASGQLRGLLDPPLDATGRAEARALGSTIAPFEPEVVASSPLRRAVETASAIAGACGLPVALEPLLVDRDYGPWAGQRIEEVRRRWGTVANAPGVEPLQQVVERAQLALEDIVQQVGPGGAAVVVAHDAINRPLLAMLDPGRWHGPDDVPQRTGCLNLVYHGLGRWLVASVDISPLDLARTHHG